MEQTPIKKLKALMRVADVARKDKKSVMEGYNEQVKRMVEHDHLHKKAWNRALADDQMEPEKLAAFYEAYAHYRDALGLDERAASAPSLPMAEDGEEGENVRRFPDAAA